MDPYLKEALEIVKAQASVRNLTEEEITSMVKRISESIRSVSGEALPVEEEDAAPLRDPKKAIREKSILCLESGQAYKILTRKHLAKYGLTPEQYREKWGYQPDAPLVCKALQRERRRKMKEMQLWEKRRKS